MSDTWIKVRVDLHDDPSVVMMGRILSASCPDSACAFSIVGRLVKLWAWADRHTTDGKVAGVTGAWIDQYVGQVGFSEAMVKAGWLVIDGSGVAFPNFDRHNGKSAKRRAEESYRKAQRRAIGSVRKMSAKCPQSVRKVSAFGADKMRTREEKRREEVILPTTPSPEVSRPRDEVWDYMAATFFGGQVKTDGDRSRLGKIVRDLKAHGATPGSIKRTVEVYRGKFPNAAVTPEAIVKHWPQLNAQRQQAATNDATLEQRHAQRRAESEERERERLEAIAALSAAPAEQLAEWHRAAVERAPAVSRDRWREAGPDGFKNNMGLMAAMRREQVETEKALNAMEEQR